MLKITIFVVPYSQVPFIGKNMLHKKLFSNTIKRIMIIIKINKLLSYAWAW